MNNDLISVIVPIYNVEKYLRQCLDSVLAQTYKNLEVVMVDDGSPDSCGEICEKYAAKYDNFKVVHKENAGLGMARNTGLEHVHGKYVMFLDSDDYIDCDLIEKLYRAVIKYGADTVKSGFRRVDDSGRTTSETRYKDEVFPGNAAAEKYLPRMIASLPDRKDSIEMSVWASLYKVSHIKEHNILFPSERELVSEDLIFNIEYMQYAFGACVISDLGYNYRVNIKSLTKSYKKNLFELYFVFYDYVKNRLTEFDYGKEAFLRLDTLQFVKIKKCIRHEQKSISGKNVREAVREIKRICSDKRVLEIADRYRKNKMMFKRRVFLFLLKHKMGLILYFCAYLHLL